MPGRTSASAANASSATGSRSATRFDRAWITTTRTSCPDCRAPSATRKASVHVSTMTRPGARLDNHRPRSLVGHRRSSTMSPVVSARRPGSFAQRSMGCVNDQSASMCASSRAGGVSLSSRRSHRRSAPSSILIKPFRACTTSGFTALAGSAYSRSCSSIRNISIPFAPASAKNGVLSLPTVPTGIRPYLQETDACSCTGIIGDPKVGGLVLSAVGLPRRRLIVPTRPSSSGLYSPHFKRSPVSGFTK